MAVELKKSLANSINLLGQAAPLSDSRPRQRLKDTKHIYLPGMFPDGKFHRFDVNQNSAYPTYGFEVSQLGDGKLYHTVMVVPGATGIGGYEPRRPR